MPWEARVDAVPMWESWYVSPVRSEELDGLSCSFSREGYTPALAGEDASRIRATWSR